MDGRSELGPAWSRSAERSRKTCWFADWYMPLRGTVVAARVLPGRTTATRSSMPWRRAQPATVWGAGVSVPPGVGVQLPADLEVLVARESICPSSRRTVARSGT